MHLSIAYFLDPQDCRGGEFCDTNAQCEFDFEEGYFQCGCKNGFIGNGLVCRRDEGKYIIMLH